MVYLYILCLNQSIAHTSVLWVATIAWAADSLVENLEEYQRKNRKELNVLSFLRPIYDDI